MTRGGKRTGSGRKLIGSDPLPSKTIRCTDQEYAQIKEYIKKLRSEKQNG